ncbi:MAG: hypothetical protein NTW19_01445, partial [Planctomycetota bacterium]|nr:hypothetical protein [Planctomycetota bacterium]
MFTAILRVLLLATTALAVPAHAPGGPAEFHVGPGGSDQNAGTPSAPFLTLERAREAVRAAPVDQPRRVFVHGSIHRTETFTLGKEDSGTAENPILWQASPGVAELPGAGAGAGAGAGGETEVRLTGGVAIPADAWHPVTDEKILARIKPEARPHVRQVDLQPLGVPALAPPPDHFQGAPPIPELFVDDQRMTLARWPNQGWATIARVIDAGADPKSTQKDHLLGVFEYPADIPGPERWD